MIQVFFSNEGSHLSLSGENLKIVKIQYLSNKMSTLKGIVINNKEHRITQNADDTSLILDGSPDSLFNSLDTIDFFSKFSGLRINSSKSKVVWIG